MTTAHSYSASADELAAATVERRLARIDGIGIKRDSRLLTPYGVQPHHGLIVLPNGLTWRQEHSRINRCWLYLVGGPALADEFAPIHHTHPDRGIVDAGTVAPPTGLRRVW